MLFHSNVRFLPRDRALDRAFVSRKEVLQFLLGKKEDLIKHFYYPKFNIALAYLTDTFGKLNDVNLTMQGPKVTVIDTDETASALKDLLCK